MSKGMKVMIGYIALSRDLSAGPQVHLVMDLELDGTIVIRRDNGGRSPIAFGRQVPMRKGETVEVLDRIAPGRELEDRWRGHRRFLEIYNEVLREVEENEKRVADPEGMEPAPVGQAGSGLSGSDPSIPDGSSYIV